MSSLKNNFKQIYKSPFVYNENDESFRDKNNKKVLDIRNWGNSDT